ncbi:squalene/phytoene synthase family protein, partial [Sphaerisporangium rhizosphaerae]
VTAFQVRKDLAYFGRFGTRGMGYTVAILKRELVRVLGLNQTWNVVIIGTGRLGQAMQLTNILRDVGEDLDRGRVYLPGELLRDHGVSHADLRAQRLTPAYQALMAHLCALAREWYAHGHQGIPALHGRARIGVATAARAYEGILDDLEAHEFDNFTRPAYLPGRQKLRLLWQQCLEHSAPPTRCPMDWAEQQLRRRATRG